MERRHSVRSFTGQRIEGPVLAALCDELDACNREGGLRMQVVLDEPRAFSSMLARYGKFANVRNYVAIIGKTADDLDERAGYYGERLVLAAQALGLNTCWAALTFSKRQVRRLAGPEERLICALALGYGATQGRPRKSKAPEDVSRAAGKPPEWFERGVRAALLAPTALNQQKFRFELLPDGSRGGINITDLANRWSCAFIQTEDVGKRFTDGSFDIEGRIDHSDIRGCNLLVQ